MSALQRLLNLKPLFQPNTHICAHVCVQSRLTEGEYVLMFITYACTHSSPIY